VSPLSAGTSLISPLRQEIAQPLHFLSPLKSSGIREMILSTFSFQALAPEALSPFVFFIRDLNERGGSPVGPVFFYPRGTPSDSHPIFSPLELSTQSTPPCSPPPLALSGRSCSGASFPLFLAQAGCPALPFSGCSPEKKEGA